MSNSRIFILIIYFLNYIKIFPTNSVRGGERLWRQSEGERLRQRERWLGFEEAKKWRVRKTW